MHMYHIVPTCMIDCHIYDCHIYDCQNNVPFFSIGNPGCVDFYYDYLRAVFEASNGTVACIGMGHLSHHKDNLHCRKIFTLAEQVEHKQEVFAYLLETYPSTKFVVGGHSVGAYMGVELMRTFSEKILKLFCLFPTLHHIVSTPNGKHMYPLLKFFTRPISSLSLLISFLPRWTRDFIILHTQGTLSISNRAGCYSILDPIVAQNALNMGYHEMHEILDLDTDHMHNIADKLIFYCCPGDMDHWMTVEHQADIRAICGVRSRIIICNDGSSHAFVLHASVQVATITWTWLDAICQNNL